MQNLKEVYRDFEDVVSYNTLLRNCKNGTIPSKHERHKLRLYWFVEYEDVKKFIEKKSYELKDKFDVL